MTAVRPPILPPGQAAQPARPNADRLAAQKAFFDLAMGKAAVPQAAAAVAQAPSPMAKAPRLPDPGAEMPQKILRPGSLLDIRI